MSERKERRVFALGFLPFLLTYALIIVTEIACLNSSESAGINFFFDEWQAKIYD